VLQKHIKTHKNDKIYGG